MIKKYAGLFLCSAALIGAIGIYVWRTERAAAPQPCDTVCQYEDQTSHLNAKTFAERVVPRLNGLNLFNLVVFVDPARECPACLFEAEYWLAPGLEYDTYDVHFFMPAETDPARIADFQDTFGIAENRLIRFARDDFIASYYRYGVLKVLYHAEKGALWYEFGNDHEEAFQYFLETVSSYLENAS